METRVSVSLARIAMLLLTILPGFLASSGDRDPLFIDCTKTCSSSGCLPLPDGSSSSCIPGCTTTVHPLNGSSPVQRLVADPWILRATMWTCEDECHYRCMWQLEESRSRNGEPPQKYFGKWPFVRVLGAQEPASAAMSALNLLVMLVSMGDYGRLLLRGLPKGTSYDYGGMFLAHGLITSHAWVWSTVFHVRDTPLTQAWDYSSAVSVVSSGLILSIIRTANLRLEAPRVMVAAPIMGFTATHILYLIFYDFDYGWNMKICVAMGIVQLLLWLGWSATAAPLGHARLLLRVSCLGTAMALLFELFDFPPLAGVFDSHSLARSHCPHHCSVVEVRSYGRRRVCNKHAPAAEEEGGEGERGSEWEGAKI